MSVLSINKQEVVKKLEELVNVFKHNRDSFVTDTYNETQLRSDYIGPFLQLFGWDVENQSGKTQFLRDVIQEEAIKVEDENSKKNPDYTLRIQGFRKLFVEVKKPAIEIHKSAKSAFQIRRYGWNANLGVSLLFNFDKLIIYDCRHKPDAKDNERVARVRIFDYSEYVSEFNDLYDLISYESVSAGRLDDLFSVYEPVGQTFDSYFLKQIESWREKLARSAVKRNANLGSDDINLLIQRLLNRIVFLRICEDRTIENHETLRAIRSYDQLKSLFEQSDKKYNSGLFNFIEDNLSFNIEIDSDILIEIFSELYYPLSPYNFAVVDSTILSEIYEKFLGSRVVIDTSRELSIVAEPEVVASDGVVPTPKLIVEKIVKDTLTPLVNGKSFSELAQLNVADICCGSGTFLISVYDFILKSSIEKLIEESVTDEKLIFEGPDGTRALTLKAKRLILESNIYGVDINPYAVEVTGFSLLLKLLEGESGPSIENFISEYDDKVLPDLSSNIKTGNSLVDSKFFLFMPSALENNDLLFKVKPFDWKTEFPFLKNTIGFDAIVGNPPYIRIQNLVRFAPEEIRFYQSEFSGYAVANKETIDKYYVFLQRAISLLKTNGCLGYIVPNKFFIIKGGKTLRKFILTNCSFLKIIHFGVSQVFPDRSTYTAILILQKAKKEEFYFKRLKKISTQSLHSDDGYIKYKQARFSTEPWVFLSKETELVFNKLASPKSSPLKSLANISVGLQTSKDDIYIFKTESESDEVFEFKKKGLTWQIEKGICRPCMLDLRFQLFDTVDGNTQIIFPYSIQGGQAVLFSEQYVSENFPLAWTYLNSNKSKLEKRNLNGKKPKWYQFGRSQSLTKFQDTPKLIWKVLSTEPSYIFDEKDLQFTGGGNGPFYSLINNSEYSIFYFMGILSHPIFERMVKAGASEFRGSYYSHGKQFIQNLPIRIVGKEDKELYDSIVQTVENLIESKQQLKNVSAVNKKTIERKFSVLQEQLHNSINKLYGISDAEVNAVLNDDMFTSELTADGE